MDRRLTSDNYNGAYKLKILVTGGAGFIGSAVVRHLIGETSHSVVNIDKLTYAGNLASLRSISNSPRYTFEQVDICNRPEINRIFAEHAPDAVLHLAAETHVDRSIDGPAAFIQTNLVGTFTLLEAARQYWSTLNNEQQARFRFHHVSTDEVFGDLGDDSTNLFTETTPYEPSSPYSASKAGSDHLARAWHRTYGMPVIVSNCSNNYGPFHFPEKLIPLIILNALEGRPLPVYGDGCQIRDWLFVEDHARALFQVLSRGKPGSSYNIGGNAERRNIDVVRTICTLLDELRPEKPNNLGSFAELIHFVDDRPGHDRRYAIDTSKIKDELGWQPAESFESGMRKTVLWYLNNRDWCEEVQQGKLARARRGVIPNDILREIPA